MKAALAAAVLVLLSTHALSGVPQNVEDPKKRIAASTDVPWLGQIAASEQAATEVWRSDRPAGQPKALRIAAYARLGELGTPASVTEQKRVEDTLRRRPLLAQGVSLAARWTHPGWHMTDPTPYVLTEIRAHDGRRWALVPSDLLGEWRLFLVLCGRDRDDSCARPKPVGPWSMRYMQVSATLEEIAPGQMKLRLVPKTIVRPSIMDGTAPIQSPALQSPETRTLSLDDIERDSDGDGWTDIEERTIGLNPERRDTDNDGIDDGRDPAPLYAPLPADAKDEDVQILQRAIFAAFGLSESRWVLFARDANVRRLEPWGLSAPIIFGKPLQVDLTKGGPGGVFVTWKISRKSASVATVEISDWEGPLAAGGEEIVLRKQQNAWIVTAMGTTWVS